MKIKKGTAQAAVYSAATSDVERASGAVTPVSPEGSRQETVRVLTRLEAEVEQLDSVIRLQRHQLLSDARSRAIPDARTLRRRLERASSAAKDMAARVRNALDELHMISYAHGFADAPDADSRAERSVSSV